MDARNAELAANGWFPCTLRVQEARLLHGACNRCPPDMHAGHRHTIGVSGVPIPDAPRLSESRWPQVVNDLYYNGLTDDQREDPAWYPSPANYARYEAEFRRRHRDEYNRWDGPGPVHRDYNADGRRAFWSVLGRTLEFVLAHIQAGDWRRRRWLPLLRR